MNQDQVETISGIANQLRIHSIAATTAAGSGHPTSCCSAADLVAALFFGQMRFDPRHPRAHNNDRFILSKGHAAPLLYAAWAEAGAIPFEDLTRLREWDCDLEGHPTPRLPFVDVSTGSLGQGLSVGLGMALSARMDGLDFKTYVLLGDGECAEGSVWEAASLAGIQQTNNLIAIVDVNRLGQSQATAFGHDMDVYRKRFEAFNWRTEVINGHDVEEIMEVLDAAGLGSQPLAILAHTQKGAGVSFLQDQDDWHGKPLSAEEAERAYAELRPKARPADGVEIPRPTDLPAPELQGPSSYPEIVYDKDTKVATREAYGNALARLGQVDARIVSLDGDTKNSTYALKFFKQFPDRSVECYIAEQNMVGVATGMGTQGKEAFASTFGAFFTRAHDQIRMAAHSMARVRLVGSHVGVSIGEDGASQMALEDLGMMRALHGSLVLYPCDAVSTEKLVEQMLRHDGVAYLRTSRPKTRILYAPTDEFPVGGAKVLRQQAKDQITVVTAGVTVFEALEAAEELASANIGVTVIDAYSVKPLASDVILKAARQTGDLVLTVEDHYPEGGLGEAVAGELGPEGLRIHRLAVTKEPHSGKGEELLGHYGLDAAGIARKIRSLVARG